MTGYKIVHQMDILYHLAFQNSGHIQYRGAHYSPFNSNQFSENTTCLSVLVSDVVGTAL